MTRRVMRAAVAIVFAAYLVMLVWLVLWKLHDPYIGSAAARAVKLVPFVATADAGRSAPREVIANVLVFVPFGLGLRLLAPRTPWPGLVLTTATASAALETAQYVLAVGVTDVTDVLTNTTGGALGVALAAATARPAQSIGTSRTTTSRGARPMPDTSTDSSVRLARKR